jgi:hypothetical protein
VSRVGERLVFLNPVWSGDPEGAEPALDALTAFTRPLAAEFGPAFDRTAS